MKSAPDAALAVAEITPHIAPEPSETERLRRRAEELLEPRRYLEHHEGQTRTARRLHDKLAQALQAKRARPVPLLHEIARFLDDITQSEPLTWPQIADARDRSIAPQLAHERRRADELRAVRQWAGWMLDDAELLMLDSETTGLAGFLVEIAITDRAGRAVFHSLVNPQTPIEPGAAAVHGITQAQLEGAPTFAQIEPQLRQVLWGKRVVIYNADFDIGVLRRELVRETLAQMERAKVPALALPEGAIDDDSLLGLAYLEAYCQGIARGVADTWLARVHAECAMEQWAIWCGDYSEFHGSYRWQKLNGGHRALDDCRACLALLHQMAAPDEMAAK